MTNTSQYRKTKVKGFYLDIYNPIDIPTSIMDEMYIIENKYDQRPDLLAHKVYGSANLWWVFAVANKNTLIDPVNDFVAGLEIVIPARSTVERSI